MKTTRHQAGFTLVEMAIVVSIIALLISAVLGGQALLRSGQTQDIIATAKDLSAAVQVFKQRYRYLPGDFPVDQEIPDVSAACRFGGGGAVDGDGQISSAESTCAAEHLIRAGITRGDPATGFITRFGAVRLIAANDASVKVTGFPASVLNLVEMANIPCDVAVDIVRKLDVGDLQAQGARVRASIASCTSGNVLFLGFAL
ncbi:type II secretion system protein [Propionivibrio sp.]|uniref:type II secretion system protein n=1 Tax=Propionivibrio sp. TaxID=2212460 RepID=UPI0039E48455